MESSSRLGLFRRSRSFTYLFLATAGSSFGTYLAAVALVLQVWDQTESGVWVAALLIADFLPIVVIGFLLGPLVDRFSRRWLMIASDLVRLGVFIALPFVDSAEGLVLAAGIAGVATGFFFPAANAAIPNLVDEEDLANANSLTVTVDTLAMTVGPVAGALLVAAWGSSVPYLVNAVTFLFSALLVARISETKLRSQDPLTRGHWRDVADGLRLVVTSRPLLTVLVVWNVALVGTGGVNVAEVVFAKDTLDAGDIGYGALVAASGVGLAIGSFLSAPALGKVGLRRNYVGSLALMGVGWGAAGLSGSIWLAVAFVVGGAAGNGSVVVSNRLLRPARCSRPVPRSRARDDHELELRRRRARHGGGRCAHRHDRCTRSVGRRRRALHRRLLRRARHDALAPGRPGRGVGGRRSELGVRRRNARERRAPHLEPALERANGTPAPPLERIAVAARGDRGPARDQARRSPGG